MNLTYTHSALCLSRLLIAGSKQNSSWQCQCSAWRDKHVSAAGDAPEDCGLQVLRGFAFGTYRASHITVIGDSSPLLKLWDCTGSARGIINGANFFRPWINGWYRFIRVTSSNHQMQSSDHKFVWNFDQILRDSRGLNADADAVCDPSADAKCGRPAAGNFASVQKQGNFGVSLR